MIPALFANSPVPLLKQVAKFAERRQDVLAGNIANIDTPGYRQRDLPVAKFQQALQSALSRRNAPPSPGLEIGALMNPQNPTGASLTEAELFPDSLFQAEIPRQQDHITFQDANNRSVESQFLEMTQNSLLQQFALEVMRNQFDQLQTVISERV